MDLSKGTPDTLVCWLQMSFLPPNCSLKLAPANTRAMSISFITKLRFSGETLSKTCCTSIEELALMAVEISLALLPSSKRNVWMQPQILSLFFTFLISISSKMVNQPQHHWITFFFRMNTMMVLNHESISSLFDHYLSFQNHFDFEHNSPKYGCENLNQDAINSNRFPIWERNSVLHVLWHSPWLSPTPPLCLLLLFSHSSNSFLAFILISLSWNLFLDSLYNSSCHYVCHSLLLLLDHNKMLDSQLVCSSPSASHEMILLANFFFAGSTLFFGTFNSSPSFPRNFFSASRCPLVFLHQLVSSSNWFKFIMSSLLMSPIECFASSKIHTSKSNFFSVYGFHPFKKRIAPISPTFCLLG